MLDNPENKFKKLIRIVSISCAFLGISVLFGWIFNIPLLKSIFPDTITMKFNTALCITSLSLALYFINSGISIQNKYLSKILAVFVLLIGTLTLLEGIFQINLGIDELIVKDFDTRFPKNLVPGSMSQTSAFCFILLGTSFLLLKSKKKTIQIICNILLNVTT